MPRPSKYKASYCNLLIEHMRKGLSFRAFAAVVQVSRETLYLWKKRHKAFADAKDIGDEQALLFWENMGIAGTVGMPEMVVDGKKVKTIIIKGSMFKLSPKNGSLDGNIMKASGAARLSIQRNFAPLSSIARIKTPYNEKKIGI